MPETQNIEYKTNWRDGQLPENWTVENLIKKHSSKPYNPDIANAFFRIGYIESWGRGTIKIIEKCKEAGLPIPKYYYEASDFWLEFRKDIYNEEYLKSLDLSQRQVKGILYTKEKGKIRNAEYRYLFDISEKTAFRDLEKLVQLNILRKEGEKKGTIYQLNVR